MRMAAFTRAFGDPAGEPEGESQIDVTRIVKVLAANARVIAVAVVVVTLIVLVLSSGAESRYRATARIVLDPTTTGTSTDTDPRRLATNVALLTTPDVLDAAARRLPGESGASLREKLTSTAATDADVIDVTATDDSAAAAAADANAVARVFLERRAANERAGILRTRAALTAQLAGVGTGPSAEAQAAAIRARLSELVVDEANAGDDLQLAEAAEPPAGPYAPRPLRNAVLAFFATLFAAALAVLLRDRLRPEARSAERDMERVSGVPLIATLAPGEKPSRTGARLDGAARRLESAVEGAPAALRRPLLGLVAKRRRARAARVARARAAAADGMRSLLGAVLLALPPGDRHVILVTSAARGQGSARLAAGLARALAQAGQETLAVSADPESSELAAALGVAPAPGLTEALEQAQAGTAVRLRAAAVPDLDTLHVVPAGRPSHDGVGLVRPGAVDALFVALGNTGYGYVVVDAPALLTAPEAWLVARNAEAAIIACPEHSSADELAAARRALERLDVRVLGAARTAPAPEPEPEPEPEDHPAAVPAPASLLAPVPQVVDAEKLDEFAAGNGERAPGVDARLLIERLRTADQPLTFSQLRDALGGPPPARVRARLRQLVEGGDVVRGGSGRRGDPYVYGPRDP
jgi:capsular polysaccharide biosynthesis protein/Mrp family chromosome partitioning ATPase